MFFETAGASVMKKGVKETASPPMNSIMATAATAWALTLASQETEAEQTGLEEETTRRFMPGDVETWQDDFSVE